MRDKHEIHHLKFPHPRCLAFHCPHPRCIWPSTSPISPLPGLQLSLSPPPCLPLPPPLLPSLSLPPSLFSGLKLPKSPLSDLPFPPLPLPVRHSTAFIPAARPFIDPTLPLPDLPLVVVGWFMLVCTFLTRWPCVWASHCTFHAVAVYVLPRPFHRDDHYDLLRSSAGALRATPL